MYLISLIIIKAPVKCPNPSAVVSVTILVQTGSNYLDTITYQCITGHELSSGNLVRTCKEGKLWDGSPPVCSKFSYTCDRTRLVINDIDILSVTTFSFFSLYFNT